MKLRLICAIACAALFASFASAQQPAANNAQSNSVSQPQDSHATVYVYRYKQFVGKALSPSVYCDDSELARMENGRFFVVTLPPGNHVFRSNDKQAGVAVDLKAGEKYYVRVEIATGFMKGHGRVLSVPPDQGSYEIKKLKPLDSDKVKDTQHVTLALAAAN
ncbi:MAG TPA: DUF2846 domain-containing protein [Candidatus Acidoferrales bacterium]|nr:DUF2846 domain-containing protein [Candidatus Acidoferrales bacterium]